MSKTSLFGVKRMNFYRNLIDCVSVDLKNSVGQCYTFDAVIDLFHSNALTGISFATNFTIQMPTEISIKCNNRSGTNNTPLMINFRMHVRLIYRSASDAQICIEISLNLFCSLPLRSLLFHRNYFVRIF